MKRKRQKNPDRIGVGKFWAWGSREVSETSNVLIQTFFLFYCTETMLLNPAIVGVLLGLSKVIDGIKRGLEKEGLMSFVYSEHGSAPI